MGRGNTYDYTAAGRLWHYKRYGQIFATYTYNWLGQRITKVLRNGDSVSYHYGVSGELLAEYSGSLGPIVEYIYADGIPIAQWRYAPDPGAPMTAAPTVTGFWPGSGAANTMVLVFGSGFSLTPGATTVTINGTAAPIVQVASTDLLFFLLPAGNTYGPIQIATAQGTATSATVFGIPLSGVQITGLWPAQGPAGTMVFVFGSGFAAGQTVSVNQSPAPIVQVLDQNLFFVMVPPGATTGPIKVTTSQGSAISNVPFTVSTAGSGSELVYLHTDENHTPRLATCVFCRS